MGKERKSFLEGSRSSFGILETRDEKHGNGNCGTQCLGKFGGRKTGGHEGGPRAVRVTATKEGSRLEVGRQTSESGDPGGVKSSSFPVLQCPLHQSPRCGSCPGLWEP